MSDPAGTVLARLEPRHITYLSRIMEGYEYFGVVTTVDRAAGLVKIRATPDTAGDVKRILASLPIQVELCSGQSETE